MAYRGWSELLFARAAGGGASVSQEKNKQETSITTGENVMVAANTGKQEKPSKEMKITRTNLIKHLTHSDECEWWDVYQALSLDEAWNKCNCGLSEFSVDTFAKTIVATEVMARIKKVCTKCGWATSQLYSSPDGFYHTKITGTEDSLEDFCDASEMWKWLEDLGYVKMKPDEKPADKPIETKTEQKLLPGVAIA